jgi:hypothetical protein
MGLISKCRSRSAAQGVFGYCSSTKRAAATASGKRRKLTRERQMIQPRSGASALPGNRRLLAIASPSAVLGSLSASSWSRFVLGASRSSAACWVGLPLLASDLEAFPSSNSSRAMCPDSDGAADWFGDPWAQKRTSSPDALSTKLPHAIQKRGARRFRCPANPLMVGSLEAGELVASDGVRARVSALDVLERVVALLIAGPDVPQQPRGGRGEHGGRLRDHARLM